MSRSATPATRNEATTRLQTPKRTTSAELPIGTAIQGSREHLRTVADGCERLRPWTQRRANTRSTPRPPEWNGKPCYAFGNQRLFQRFPKHLTRQLKQLLQSTCPKSHLVARDPHNWPWKQAAAQCGPGRAWCLRYSAPWFLQVACVNAAYSSRDWLSLSWKLNRDSVKLPGIQKDMPSWPLLTAAQTRKHHHQTAAPVFLDRPFVATGMDWDQLGRQVRTEARLMLLVALLPLGSAPWTSCLGGSPTWLYVLYLPFLLRSKVVEYQIIKKFGIEWGPALLFEYGMGVLEHLDWFTDGAFPVQAYMCEPGITAAWAAAFDQSWGWVWAPIIRVLHFCGVVVLVLILSAVAQQSAVVPFWYWDSDLPDFRLWDQQNMDKQKDFPVESRWPLQLIKERNQASRAALSADTACFAAVAMLSDKKADEAGNKCWATSQPTFHAADSFVVTCGRLRSRQYSMVLFKVVLENLGQLYLQVSFYSILFDDLSPSARFKLLVSIGAGLLAAFRRLFDVACRLQHNGLHVCFGWTLYVLPGMMILLWVSLKLYFAHTCPHHQWNFSTGCVGWKDTCSRHANRQLGVLLHKKMVQLVMVLHRNLFANLVWTPGSVWALLSPHKQRFFRPVWSDSMSV